MKWILAAGAIVAVLAIGLLIAAPNFGGALQTTSISYPISGIESARADISFGAGANNLNAIGDSNNLIEGTLETVNPPTFSVSHAGDRADIHLAPGATTVFIPPFSPGEKWDIGLNSGATYQIDLNMGVGQSKIDLSKLRLSGGEINGGVGNTELGLSNKGMFTLNVNGGVGELRIVVPQNMAVRAEVNGGLGAFHGMPRLQRVDDKVYETEGFSSAENAVTLIINGGVGSITLVDGE